VSADRSPECLEQLRAGGLLLIVDSASEPPEAVLACSGARITPEGINFMVTHGRGLVCLVLARERMRQLGIPLMSGDPTRPLPAYGASIEARHGVSTGISASDRATTVRAAVADDATPAALVMPGHVTTIEGAPGGVLVRAALPEAASDLSGSRASARRRRCARCSVATATSPRPRSSRRSPRSRGCPASR